MITDEITLQKFRQIALPFAYNHFNGLKCLLHDVNRLYICHPVFIG